MLKRIKTNGKKTKIDVCLSAKSRRLIAVGFDPKFENTEYFFRLMPVNGVEKYTFSMPLTPKFLDILIFDLEEGHNPKTNLFKVQKMTINDLATPIMLIDTLTAEFVGFASDFAQKAGHYKTGKFRSKKRNFEIIYVDRIEGINTPSRIHATKNYIEVSREYFINMTIPSRLNILFHEFSHNYLNIDPESETEADNNGLNLYLSLGHSSIESVYSLTRVFQDINAHVGRLQNMDRILKLYNSARDAGKL